ncbi:vWA domain-containing protein [Deinococcus hohokamensis]|uniref:VWA domain-containing protein n=1 Tax=Deinococcus hohokamensis TaxID=309883 RepID=A0ABV9I571_9DEIO
MSRAAALTLLLLMAPYSGAQAPSFPGGAATAACALPAGDLPQRTRVVFVLDTSGSMRGEGDGQADIFAGVKGALDAYVRRYRPDRAEVVTFDRGVREVRRFEAPASQPAWGTFLARLQADGQNTYLYRSLHAALSPLRGAGEYLTTVFVLTDGIDNDPARAYTARSALDAFVGRGPLDRLHYLALGTQLPDDLRAALEASAYADGHTYAPGQLPALGQGDLAGGARAVTVPGTLALPLAPGTPLHLGSPLADRLQLSHPTVQPLGGQASGQKAAQAALEGAVHITARGPLPPGSAALLCATPRTSGVHLQPVALLLHLNPQDQSGLRWLNPGADLRLRPGEETVLRYRAGRAAALGDQPLALTQPQGLEGEVGAAGRGQGGTREFSVRLRATGGAAAGAVRPLLRLGAGRALPLPVVRLEAAGRAGATGPAAPPTSLEGQPRVPARFLTLLLGAAALVGLTLLLGRRRAAPAPRPRPTPAPVPGVEGLEYSEERTLALITAHGEAMGVPAPLGGPFDVGQVARVPHLSGLRAQQHQGGLQILRVPDDLEVSQGGRLLRPGDVVRPGTLLGIAVARPARAPEADLGGLAGLGVPLTLRADDLTLYVSGPYGEHALVVRSGVSDLGMALQAPVLLGLKVAASGTHLLLVEVPASLDLRRPGESAPLRPGTYLPQTATLLDVKGEGA